MSLSADSTHVPVVEPRARLVERDTRDMGGPGSGHIARDSAGARRRGLLFFLAILMLIDLLPLGVTAMGHFR